MSSDEEIKPDKSGNSGVVKTRPVLLTMICLFSFVYFGLVTLLFFTGLLKTGLIAGIMNQYIALGDLTTSKLLLIFGAGFLLHGLAFSGVVLIWKLRRTGFYFLGLSCLVIAAYQLFNPLTTIASTAIYILLVLTFGIFYNRMN
ncbi:MAG: hypothetical protein Q8M08_16805 [Bacteroidales bacterium]|nr:hypothetical protein [Bacteroidales bacterium]